MVNTELIPEIKARIKKEKEKEELKNLQLQKEKEEKTQARAMVKNGDKRKKGDFPKNGKK